jgi:hypothetical protein
MRVTIVAHTNSRNPRVETDIAGALHVYVNAPPIDGKANEVIVDTLAKYFKTKKSLVSLIRGAKSKQKVFEIGSD